MEHLPVRDRLAGLIEQGADVARQRLGFQAAPDLCRRRHGFRQHLVSASHGSSLLEGAAPAPTLETKASTIMTSTICSTETAAIVGSMALMMLSNIFFGSVMFEPPRNIATTSSSKDEMKARNIAEISAGRICGKVTRQIALGRLAPRLMAASS